MVIIDIETAPQARALTLEYPKAEREYPKNYKNADAIERWYAEDEKGWRAGLSKAASLNPRLGRVVAVGAAAVDLRGLVHATNESRVLVDLAEANERVLVQYAMESIGGADLVTFNGQAFDLPYLHARAVATGVAIPYRVGDYLRRYTMHPHADLAMILSNWKWGQEGDTLHGWCEAFGIPVADKTTGSEIGDAVERGDSDFIIAHCKADVDLTAQLTARMALVGLIAGR